MSRRLVVWVLGIIAMFIGPSVVLAEPWQQQVQVYITSPEVGEELRGLVEIRGSAVVPNFQFYKVEFGVGPNPAQWAVIGSLHNRPVVNDVLEIWDTTVLPDGVYTLRLQGVKQDGNWEEFVVRQVVIANTRPTSTPTPTVTPTPTTTPTLQATPEATPTPHVIGPGAVQAKPTTTPTPTLSAPDRREPLPFDLEGWGQSFCFGGLAMMLVFILLGIVFGVRRLL